MIRRERIPHVRTRSFCLLFLMLVFLILMSGLSPFDILRTGPVGSGPFPVPQDTTHAGTAGAENEKNPDGIIDCLEVGAWSVPDRETTPGNDPGTVVGTTFRLTSDEIDLTDEGIRIEIEKNINPSSPDSRNAARLRGGTSQINRINAVKPDWYGQRGNACENCVTGRLAHYFVTSVYDDPQKVKLEGQYKLNVMERRPDGLRSEGEGWNTIASETLDVSRVFSLGTIKTGCKGPGSVGTTKLETGDPIRPSSSRLGKSTSRRRAENRHTHNLTKTLLQRYRAFARAELAGKVQLETDACCGVSRETYPCDNIVEETKRVARALVEKNFRMMFDENYQKDWVGTGLSTAGGDVVKGRCGEWAESFTTAFSKVSTDCWGITTVSNADVTHQAALVIPKDTEGFGQQDWGILIDGWRAPHTMFTSRVEDDAEYDWDY